MMREFGDLLKTKLCKNEKKKQKNLPRFATFHQTGHKSVVLTQTDWDQVKGSRISQDRSIEVICKAKLKNHSVMNLHIGLFQLVGVWDINLTLTFK